MFAHCHFELGSCSATRGLCREVSFSLVIAEDPVLGAESPTMAEPPLKRSSDNWAENSLAEA